MASDRKFEVRITYCCCCGLTVASILIAVYTFIIFALFTGLALWGLIQLIESGPLYYGTNTPVGDGSPNAYYDSLGLYTEEIKFFAAGIRYPVLIINIVIYLLLIISAILICIALCTGVYWLLLPWIGVMILEIVRSIISCCFIWAYCDGDIRQIAVGIFFFGLQLFHGSMLLILFAKFQRMQNRERGGENYKVIERTGERGEKAAIMEDGTILYPTMPVNVANSNYAYSGSPHIRREGYYQPDYNQKPGYAERPYAADPSTLQRSHR